MTTIHDTIDSTVKSNDVVLFMKGNAQMPMCGFSGRSVQILQHLGVAFKDVNVLDSMTNCARASRTTPTGPPCRSSTSRASSSAALTS